MHFHERSVHGLNFNVFHPRLVNYIKNCHKGLLGEDLWKVGPADYVLSLLGDDPASMRAYDSPAGCRNALL
jgi:hypothetical protein